MKLHIVIVVLVCITNQIAGKEYPEPDELDTLLKTGRYDEFENYMGISVAGLSRPEYGRSLKDPMMNLALHEGDILVNPEQGRQGVRFDRYPTYRWPGDPAVIPYSISGQFSRQDRRRIHNSIVEWNDRIPCVQFLPRRRESNFIFIFPGGGCYTYLGRNGGIQPVSLGTGCVHQGIVFHELEHVTGIHHEHTRYDRDDYVEVLWENIPPRWHSQYAKNDNETFNLLQNYDYYSVMHYRLTAPETGLPAFRILQDGVDTNRMGYANDFTPIDEEKIADLYCPEQKK